MTSRSDMERYFMLQELCLRSTKFLHYVFRRRWETEVETIWEDDDEHRKMFLDGHGRQLYKEVTSLQKTVLNSAKLEDWDLSLICLAIRRFQTSINYEKENTAVHKLGTIGSLLASRHPHYVSESEYGNTIRTITANLKTLSMNRKDVETLIREVESVKASEAYTKFYNIIANAKKCVKEGSKGKAYDYFSKAINVPNLLHVHVAAAYLDRAAFCTDLSLESVAGREKLESALTDAKTSLRINIFSWSAHFTAAYCYYMKRMVSLAIFHNEQAMSTCPIEKKSKLDEFQRFFFRSFNNDLLKPTLMTLTSEEYMILIEEENIYMDTITPVLLTPERDNFNDSDANDPGFEYAMEGFKHFYGWDIDQDYVMAVEQFQKSADCRNSQGTVALAKCYLNGYGVAQSSYKAYTKFFEATQMCKTWPGLLTPIRGDRGVAEAQHALGRMCFEAEAYQTAGFWYEWSMDNGHGYSATLYGNMIACRLLAEKGDKMAKMCWKEGVNLKTPTAVKWLLRYYLTEAEPDLAEEYFRYGRAAKNPIILRWSQDCFSKLITEIRKYRETKENELQMFEKDHKFTWKGLTFMDRLHRMHYYSSVDQNILVLDSFLRKRPNSKVELVKLREPKMLTEDMIQEIQSKAQTGVKSAREFAEVLANASAIREVLAGENELTEDERLTMLNLFYEIVATGKYLINVLDLPSGKIVSNIHHLVKNPKNLEKGLINEKLGVCCSFVEWLVARDTKKWNEGLLRMLTAAISQYPDNIHYYEIITTYLKYFEKNEGCRYWAKKGLDKDPNNADLLFKQAVFVPSLVVPEQCIEYYQKFTQVAPRDHPMIPEAFYFIAYHHLQQFCTAGESVDVTKQRAIAVKENLRQAVEAESDQFPCYLPYEKNGIFDQITLAFEKAEQNESEWRQEEISFREKNETLFVRKHYLRSPTRKLLIRLHRRDFRRIINLGSDRSHVTGVQEVPSVMEQAITQNLLSLKPITLQEMNVVENYCFENRKIELTVLDNSFIFGISISCVVEDDNGDVIRLHIYNADLTEKTVQRFATGSRFAVANPNVTFESGEKHNWLRVEGLNCIFFMDSVKQMCGFCGEENASHSCPTCSRCYCSSECLQLDVDRHDHEVICLDARHSPETQ